MITGLVAGRIAFVTGAGSGIGRAACQALAREGATVIAADRNYEAAQNTVKNHLVLAAGVNDHSSIEVDVTSKKSVQNAVDKCLELYKKPASIVVNSAGITRDNWMLKLSEEDYDAVMNVNLKGSFLMMQLFSQAMSNAKIPSGSIVNLSSIVAKYGNIGQSNYSSSKAGIVAMTQTAAKELGQFNIRVNCILPGFIKTPMVDKVPEKVLEKMLKLVPLGRMGEPGEVADLITFLCSDKSSFITGTSIDISGGF